MEDGAMLIRSWAKLGMRVTCCRNKPIKIIILDYCKWIYCNMKIGMCGILEKWKAKREKLPLISEFGQIL